MNMKITIFFIFFSTIYTASFCQIIGKITMDKGFYDDMKLKYHDKLFTEGIIIEIWNVNYVDVANNKNGVNSTKTRIYLNNRLDGSHIEYSEQISKESVEIKFDITTQSLNFGSYAILYYLNSTTDKYKSVYFNSNVQDVKNRINPQYEINFSSMIGNKVCWGLTSIEKKSKEYKINLQNHQNQPVAFSFNSLLDVVFSTAEVIFEGGVTMSGIVVDNVGSFAVQSYGFVQSLVLDDGVIIPRRREITSDEYRWANDKIFNRTLPPIDKIIITNFLGAGKRPFVFPNGKGKILMNLGRSGYENPKNLYVNKGYNYGEVFIHELTHVWQIHNMSDLQFDLSATYDQVCHVLDKKDGLYNFDCGKNWSEYKLEQKAVAVQNCYKKREINPYKPYCEDEYIIKYIRQGTMFRTKECVDLISQINSTKNKISQRKLEIKSIYLKENGETLIKNSDGTIKVGTDKNPLPNSYYNNDSIIKKFQSQLNQQIQKQQQINCF